MFAATDISLINLIEHKQVMYAVVDYMDAHATELVNEDVYIHAVRDLIAAKRKKTEKQRLARIFDLDNLLSTGLIIEVDKSTQSILFHSAVIEVFRLFDSKRLRELTNADLQDLSARLDNARKNLLQSIGGSDHQALYEQIEVIFLLLSEISSKIQTNTRSLQSRAHNLAGAIDANTTITSIEEVQQKRQTLAEIQTIYQRNILPMLEFLNEYEQMKGLSPLKKITALHDIFADFSYNDEAYRVQQYKISITTHYKTIEEISLLLERYSRQEVRYRKQYNSIEAAWQSLLESGAALSDGKLNSQYFNPDDSVFNHSYFFSGLKQYRSAQKSLLNWAEINHRAYLDEYLLNAQQRVLDEAANAQAHRLVNHQDQQQKQQEKQHKRELDAFIKTLQFTLPVDDIYQEIFRQMEQNFELFVLSDLLLVFKMLELKKDLKYQVHFELPQASISYQQQKLNYWRRELIL